MPCVATIIKQPMLAVNIKAESYIHEFKERVRVQPPMIIYLPDDKSERSQKSQRHYNVSTVGAG